MSEPSTPSTPERPLAPSAPPATPVTPAALPPVEYAPEAPAGPQFLPADGPAIPPSPQAAIPGYNAGEPASPYGAPIPANGAVSDPTAYPPVPDADGHEIAAQSDAAPAAPENVGRGILFSLLAVVLGAVLAGLIYQMGFIASITSFAMAFAAIWLYSKGAGAPPRAGTWPLIGVIVVGVILSLFTMVGWSLYAELSAEYPSATAGDILPYVFELLFNPEVWSYVGTDALIFVAFAALGTFTTLRQLRRSAAPQG